MADHKLFEAHAHYPINGHNRGPRPSSSSSHSSPHSQTLSAIYHGGRPLPPAKIPPFPTLLHLLHLLFLLQGVQDQIRSLPDHLVQVQQERDWGGEGPRLGVHGEYQLDSEHRRKVIGSLPVVDLLARFFSDEGGVVGGDLVDFAEFRRRVGKKCSITDSRAFYSFKDRCGRRRTNLKSSTTEIPIASRAEKALEAVYVCCFGEDPIEEED